MTTKYLTGKDYPHLCPSCRAVIDMIVGTCSELPDEYASDEEGPCDFAYDQRLFCGGNECINGSAVQIEKALTEDDIREWYACRVTQHVAELTGQYGLFQIWGGLDPDGEPLSVIMMKTEDV